MSPADPGASERTLADSHIILRTERLVLRGLKPADAPRIHHYLQPKHVVAMMLRAPHPYLEGEAEAFLARVEDAEGKGEQHTFAITLRPNDDLIGCIGLHLDAPHHRAEIGYWVGEEHSGNGYATEAARAVAKFGFEHVGLNRIHAGYYHVNPASGRVLSKAGFKHEGLRPMHICRFGEFYDLVEVGMLRSDWLAHIAAEGERA